MKEIIGGNLKKLRMANGYTDQNVADYLQIGRSAYANYESGLREMPFEHLCKAADLFGCEISSLLSEEEILVDDMLACAFRINGMNVSDMNQIAKFKKLVLNYIKTERLLKE
jgi:transcriptional regulator with XRE-family HTH domain